MVAQYVSEKISDLSAFIFLDTPQIRIQDVSNEYRYQIRIQVSDTLWVEVSVGKLTKSSCTSDCSLQTIPSKIN
jgi:hypothetical protein